MKISVIVPVYNAEKYLKKCIESVRKQKYTNWELILVNDGSTDGSIDIINQAIHTDTRIKKIDQQNQGPGNARNNGIEIATGDFVVFLDSDDFLSEDYFEFIRLKGKNNDLIFIDVNQISEDGRILKKESMSKYKKWSKDRIIRSQMTGKIPWGGVRKCVKLKLLRDNKIKYTSHSIGEEALYSFRILQCAKNIDFIDEQPVYFYVNHEKSQSKLQVIDPWGPVVENLYGYLLSNNLYEKYSNTLNSFNITATVIALDKIGQMNKIVNKDIYAKERLKKFQRFYNKHAGIDWINTSFKANIFIPFIILGIYKPIFWGRKIIKMLKI